MDFPSLEAIYKKWLVLDDDPDILRLLYASLLTNRFKSKPVWMILVGPPACGKTELLRSLSESHEVIVRDTLTKNTLASNYGSKDENALLKNIDGKVLVICDFSPITQMRAEDRQQIMSDLRAAYDGTFIRQTGKDILDFTCRFGIIAAATPAFETGRSTESTLGERFLQIRVRLGRYAKDAIHAKAFSTASKDETIKKELQAAARIFLAEFQIPTKLGVPESIQPLVIQAAEWIARLRSGVNRDSYTKSILFPAETTEHATRLIRQLALFSASYRSLGADEAMMKSMIRRLVQDNIPYVRLRILQEIAKGTKDAKFIAKRVRMSHMPVSQTIEDMQMLDILTDSQEPDLVDHDFKEVLLASG